MKTLENKLEKLEARKPEKKIMVVKQLSDNKYKIGNDVFNFNGNISEHLKKKYPNKRIILDNI